MDLARGAGGGLQSPLWRAILASALGGAVQTTPLLAGAARGAAVLAGLVVGLYATPDVRHRVEGATYVDAPALKNAEFERSRAVLEEFYPALAPIFARLPSPVA
jgi:sugar (pentulose or hexulose) kinase